MGTIVNSEKINWLPLFFGLVACSWMPHWSCHYYRIETGTSFVVGSFSFSVFESILAMLLYSALIALNLFAISYVKVRFVAALASGILHLTLGFIHITRLLNPYTFIVFDYDWSLSSSLREVIMIFPLGIACIAVAFIVNRKSDEH